MKEQIMFDQFTGRARKTLELAEQEAKLLNHRQVQPIHLIIGLVKEGFGVGGDILKKSKIDLVKARKIAAQVLPPEQDDLTGIDVVRSQTADTILVAAAYEAQLLEHTHIGTEHLLLALTNSKDELVMKFLAQAKVKAKNLRKETLWLLGASADSIIISFGPNFNESRRSELLSQILLLVEGFRGSKNNISVSD